MSKKYMRVQKNFDKNGISRVPHSVAPCQSRLNFVHFSRRKNVQILLMFLCE